MDKINNIGLSRLLTSVYDFDGFNEQEVWCRIAQKINIIIEHFNYLDKKIENEKENNKAKFDYLLGEGLTEAVAKIILEKIADGTIGELINETLLQDINNKIDENIEKINEQLDNISISVTNFGAKGDGITDDTEAIQNAINASSKTKTKLLFPAGKYKVRQIVLKNNIYEFQSGCKILQSINVPCIVNEFIDLFGHGRKYEGINSIYTAIENNEFNSFKIEGNLIIEKSSDYLELSHEEQLAYKGNAWIDSSYGYMAVFPINFCGLADTNIENIKIEFETRESNINLGFSTRTSIEKCVLKNGKDNCLQLFACIGCIAGNNKITDGGGGLLVMQNCKLCTFISNSCSYTKPTTGVNSYIISIKNSENCVVIGNNINGFGEINSIGIALTNQGTNNKGIIVSNNTILGCKHSVVNELSDNTSINNNTISNGGKNILDGGIVVNSGENINILDNKIRTASSGIVLNGGNNINISFNDIIEIPINFAGIIFGDTNNSTVNYVIEYNKLLSENADARGIIFVNKILYNKNNIDKNDFGAIYIGNRLVIGTKYVGEMTTLKNTYNIQLRKLQEPFLYGNDKDLFTITKESVGVYLLEFAYHEKLKLKNTFIFSEYKCGYGNDLELHSLNVVYDDISNEENNFYAIRICLKDKNNKPTDNPTTTPNAPTLNNFGINLSIVTDYSIV